MLAARLLLSTLVALALAACSSAASAQIADRCLAVSQAPRLVQPVALKKSEVRLTFVGHSTWLIESAAGVSAATDYNDYVRPQVVPDIATMNRAHTTHYSNAPDPTIKHVLRGWSTDGGPVKHDVTYNDVRVRNVVTNIRDWAGGAIAYGNSIFVFEIAGMCIGHLGHLHHTLTEQQIGQIGQLDVVLVPVDGSYTMDVSGMVEVLRSLARPPDPADALLQSLHAGALRGAHPRRLPRRDVGDGHHRRLAGDPAERAEGARAAGNIQPPPRRPIRTAP